jgi:hypothetical protein
MIPVDQASEHQLAQDNDPSIKTLKKKTTTTKLKRKEKREKQKSKCEDLVISQPDYDSFRSMADVIRDPQERVSMFGARPTPESAGAQTGRVKRMLSIIGIGHQRKGDTLRGGNREQWELIDPEALRRAPIPESLVIPPTVAFAVASDASSGGGQSSEAVERRLTAPPVPAVLVPRPPTPSSAHDSQNPPPLPPIPVGLVRPQSAPNQRRAQTMPPTAGGMGTTTSTSTVATSNKELVQNGCAHPQHEQSPQQLHQLNGGDGAGEEEEENGEAVVLCSATYTFKAQQPTELSFQEGYSLLSPHLIAFPPPTMCCFAAWTFAHLRS